MSTMIVPEFVLLDNINKAIKAIRDEYVAAPDKTQTWLYRCYNGIVIDDYDAYRQIVSIIVNTPTGTPRFFKGDIMFNSNKNTPPSFHITLPSESLSDGNSVGSGEWQATDLEIHNTDDTVADVEIPVYTRRIQCIYNVVVTSDNSMEIVMLYAFMRGILISIIPSLHLAGLQNIGFAGNDIQPYNEVGANQLYMRSVSLSLQYETSSPSLFSLLKGKSVEVDGEPVECID